MTGFRIGDLNPSGCRFLAAARPRYACRRRLCLMSAKPG